MKHPVSRLAIVVLVLLATTAMVLQAGSVPHLHAGGGAGFYNQEHDLTLLAGLAGHGLPAEPTPSFTIDAASASVAPSVPERPAVRLARSGDSRAPPAA